MIQSQAMLAKYLNRHQVFLKEFFPEIEENILHCLAQIQEKHRSMKNPTVARHLGLLETLPDRPQQCTCEYTSPTIKISSQERFNPEEKEKLTQTLLEFSPWRKGPFELFGIFLDAEWRSDKKWARIESKLPLLKDKKILDIGCNSGYYLYKMAAHSPKVVLGIDPSSLFYLQFQVLQHYFNESKIDMFPLKAEALNDHFSNTFDVIFCMGILYHQKDPQACLRQLRKVMAQQGYLVLETLILPGDHTEELIPQERYAKMSNVYCVPTLMRLKEWIQNSGFTTCECLDITETSIEEQRPTAWMTGQSLQDFLDPQDFTKTIEGYPRPLRCSLLLR